MPSSGLKWAVLACALTACASRPETPGAAPAPAAHHHTAEAAPAAGAGFTAADVQFMQHMIGHHSQALRMVAMVPDHGASADVVRMAQKIGISQRDEIGLMRGWLEERRQPVPDDAHPHAMMMPGMLTADQLAQLDAARGREFDRLFLTFMTRHHEGALQMVRELFRTPGAGQDPDLFRFVTDVDADQRDEILVMERLLHTLQD